MEIKANSKEDIRKLAEAFRTIPREQYWIIMAKVHQLRLMKFTGCVGFLFKYMIKFRGEESIFFFFNRLDKIYPKAVEEALYETIRHIVNGKDVQDEDSIGGWSQREIDLLLSSVNFSSLK